MKRFTALFLILTMAIVLAGCQESYNPNVLYDDPLSEELKQEITSVFLWEHDKSFGWDRIDPCLGTINSCVILIDRASVTMDYWTETIADCVFEWGQPVELYAFRNGEICYLREAYEHGWLTKEHIQLIYAKHEEIGQNWEQISLEWYLAQRGISPERFSRDPDVLFTDALSEVEKNEIRSDISSKYGKTVRWRYVDPYYGMIHNCAVVVVHPFGTPKEEPWAQEIAGYTFTWDNAIELYVRYFEPNEPSVVCTLAEAYRDGLLAEKQIGILYERHEQYRLEFPRLLQQWEEARKNQ